MVPLPQFKCKHVGTLGGKWPPKVPGWYSNIASPEGAPSFCASSQVPVLASGSVHCQHEQWAICLRQRGPSLTVTPSRGPHFRLGLIMVPAVPSQAFHLPMAFIGIWLHIHKSIPSFLPSLHPSFSPWRQQLLLLIYCGSFQRCSMDRQAHICRRYSVLFSSKTIYLGDSSIGVCEELPHSFLQLSSIP